MPTTVKSSETVTTKLGQSGGPGVPGPNGNGSRGNGWHRNRDDSDRKRPGPEAYRVIVWIVIGAVVMMFAALSSTYIALSGNQGWQPVPMPRIFLLSTGIIIGSSVTMEVARRSLQRGNNRRHARYLHATLGLGLVFLGSQLLGWRGLVRAGVYLSGQPHGSFFYFFTAIHGLHLIGGVIALCYLVVRNRRQWDDAARRAGVTDAAALYWHFMDGVWIWLFLLLRFWR